MTEIEKATLHGLESARDKLAEQVFASQSMQPSPDLSALATQELLTAKARTLCELANAITTIADCVFKESMRVKAPRGRG